MGLIWCYGNEIHMPVMSSLMFVGLVRPTRNVEVVGSSPIKGPRCFLEQEMLHLLLSTGWFQKQFRA